MGGMDYKRIMAITGHKTFADIQRYDNPSEHDIKDYGTKLLEPDIPSRCHCEQSEAIFA